MPDVNLTLRPIGIVRTAKQVKFLAPYQPDNTNKEQNVIEIDRSIVPREALHDLVGFSRIWLIWWFHKNQSWRPKVLPPRGRGGRRGVFSTRSPHRPNPIGISSVSLIAVEDFQIVIGACDLVEGTPIFDIKPYVPSYDAFPDEKIGWLEQVEAFEKAPAKYIISYQPLALEQLTWLKNNWNINFRDSVESILSKDPYPHRTRRIYNSKHGGYCIYAGAWILYFSIEETTVSINCIANGFSASVLSKASYEPAPDREAQLAFAKVYKTNEELKRL